MIQENSAHLAGRIVAFSRYLKERGFRVFSSNVTDSLRGLQEIDLSRKEDFFTTLRTHLACNDTEWRLFAEYFENFWNHPGEEKGETGEERADPVFPEFPKPPLGEPSPDTDAPGKAKHEGIPEKEYLEGAAYSPIPNLERQDLACFQKEDIQTAQLLMKQMISLFRVTATRRSRRSMRPADIDFRRVAAKSLKTGGIPLKLYFRRKKRRLKKLVVLADVSGSMERYARFVIPFILGLRGVGSKAEVFVFSTSLTAISPYLRKLSLEQALERISREVPDWSGGTRIGHSLRQFHEAYGERLLNRKSVVVVLSDGWDLGGRKILEKEMDALSRRTRCILWLNPLPIHSKSCILAKGMEAALPYVDHFLPADSLESLRRVGRVLAEVMSGK